MIFLLLRSTKSRQRMTSPFLLLVTVLVEWLDFVSSSTMKTGQGNISPIEAKMSSLSRYPASNCIDGNPNTMCHTGGSESYPWITLVIPRSIVRGIRITNRDNCCRNRMKNMKIWVGNGLPSTTAVEYTGGALLGTFSGPGTNVHVLALNANTEMVGTHVVVQMKTNYINLMEIEVLGEAAPDTGAISPIGARMSDTWLRYPAFYCIDGSTTASSMCHTRKKVPYPWITVVIPRSFVRGIRITNRAFCCWDRMKNVKIWVGNNYPTSANVEYTGGTLLGTFSGPGTKGQVLPIKTDKDIVGTHVVVQMKTEYINLMEIEVFGEPAPEMIIALEARMSSRYNSDFPARNCIDRNTNTMCHTRGSESYPWVTVVIPRSIVRGVRITNRDDCCWDRMKNMKIWVGNNYPTSANVEYTGGSLLGTFSGPGTKGRVLPINTDKDIVGTHVVVQMKTDKINLMEIEVFGKPAPYTGECYCGLAKRKPTRIVGGEETEVNEYPWQVKVGRGCGGSVISDQWVLTAGHCVDRGLMASNLKVFLGEHDLTDADDADTIRMDVAEIIIHEGWPKKISRGNQNPRARYDIALLRLKNKINFDIHPHIRPICLPAFGSNKDYSGYTATATGWGRTKHGGNISPHLLEVDLTVMTKTECVSKTDWWTKDKIICTKVNGLKGTCHGDSGGPLVTKEAGDSGTAAGQNYELIGVNNFLWDGKCLNEAPEGFTRVTEKLAWIHEKTKNSWRTCSRT